MANDFQITADDFGRQIVRGANAMLALCELDKKLAECVSAGGEPALTKSQKRTLRKALDSHAKILDAVEHMKAHFANFSV